MAGHRVTIQNNWVPASSDEGLWKRSKRQKFLVLLWLCYMNLFSNTEFQPKNLNVERDKTIPAS